MAMIVDAFAGKLVGRLTKVIEEKAIMVLGVKDELQRLRRRMERIARVLKDAEKRRIQDETVKGWIDELKDLMYDADDIIDLCMIQGTGLLQDVDHHSQLPESSTTASTRGTGLLQDDHHSPAESSTTAFKRVRHSLSSFSTIVRSVFSSTVPSVPLRYEIADKIKSLNDRLTEISEDKDKFNFIISSKSSADAYVMNEASYRQSSSLLEPDVVGWDIKDATKSLVELLVSPHEQKCRLFAIVGMGGIGKTTLAQQIYNDPKINDAFVLRSWIWVSKSFTSTTDLLKEIIRKTGGRYGESTTIDELQTLLFDVLRGKTLFLVLDDIWDDKMWNDLIKNPIGGTTTKCRVLVTTRDKNTCVKMGAIHIHNVNKLSLDSGWELLCKKVFTNNNTQDMQRLKDIGMKIVEKCDGLPVAIKVIASVLLTKGQNRREWENVLNSDAWTITGLPEELQGALYLSYEALPSALKHCFLYCALYPRGIKFELEDLVCQWIAEGYIEAKGNASMEDVAKSYYMELICRSFLQPDPDIVDMSICTIHDLMRALAEFFAGDESFSGDPQEEKNTESMKKLRRLTVTSNRESVSIPHLDCLRNLLLCTPPSLNTQVIGNLKQLRLLFLNGDEIENIPDSIGDLLHLRLLNLEHSCIQSLPDSLGNLINLQFLMLNDCKSLHILPNNVTKLYNLRWLRVVGTPLNYMPKGIGKLEHLHHVEGLIFGDSTGDDGEEGCNLEEVQMLEKLSLLHVKNLEKSSSKSSSVLSSKIHLRVLLLCCTPNYIYGHIQQQEMDKIVQVFDELCPPPCLEDLVIQNFFGGRYPKWMSSTSITTALQELIYLKLINCSNCPHLPQLGQLPQLKYLKIEGATAVVSIGPEFLGNNGEPTENAFPKLETLLFINMSNWEEWSLISGEEEDNEPESSKPLMFFPHLNCISIEGCPKLKALPSGLNRVNLLSIREAHSLSRVSHLPALKELEVNDCPILECVEKLESLQILYVIDNEEDNTSLPQWLISFIQQRQEKPHDDLFKLHLECSVRALKGCLKGRPHWSFIQQVPRFIGYAKKQSMYLKYTRELNTYETNITDED